MSERNIYRFDVEEHRYTTLWVEGDNEEIAHLDASIMAAELEPADWEDYDLNVDALGPAVPTRRVTVWSGGPDGHEYTYDPEATP